MKSDTVMDLIVAFMVAVVVLVGVVIGSFILYSQNEFTSKTCEQNNMTQYGLEKCFNESDNSLYQIITVNRTTHLIKTHI